MNNRDSICRVCRLEDPSMDMVNLRDKDAWDKFQRITQVKVLIHDTFPKKICQDCNRILELCHSFIAKAQDADQVFREEVSLRESALNEVEEGPWEFLYVDDDIDDHKSLVSVSSPAKAYPNDEQDKENNEKLGNVNNNVAAQRNLKTEIHLKQEITEKNDLKIQNPVHEISNSKVHCDECPMTFRTRLQYRCHKYRQHPFSGPTLYHDGGTLQQQLNRADQELKEDFIVLNLSYFLRQEKIAKNPNYS